jgi:hypothetical protein
VRLLDLNRALDALEREHASLAEIVEMLHPSGVRPHVTGSDPIGTARLSPPRAGAWASP